MSQEGSWRQDAEGQELHEDLQDVRQEIQSGVILVDASHSQLNTQYSEL
ncbi:MAG: hypothetical protein VX603_07615 [Gemmatimonadota bacterium]|nr:hypothetical protein [Gemmatimonadota bacterium]